MHLVFIYIYLAASISHDIQYVTDIFTGTYFSFSPHIQTQQIHLFSRYDLLITRNKQYMSQMKGVIKYHHPITMPFSLEQILINL